MLRAACSVFRIIAILAIFAATSEVHAASQRLHRYTVTLDDQLSVIQVRACFDGAAPSMLVAQSLDASTVLEDAAPVGGKKKLEPNGTELRLGTLPNDSCITYRSNLNELRGGHERGGAPTRHVGADLVTDLGLWLWRPEPLGADEDVEVSFILPPETAVSAPWQLVATPNSPPKYRIGHSPYDWPGAVSFGHFTEQNIAAGGAQIHLAVLDGRPKTDVQQMTRAVEQAASAVMTLYGRFPVPSLQVEIVPGARGNEPVPSAYVLRGGGPSAHFFINQRRPAAEFDKDWTMVHELSHLLLPFIRSEDAWLSEGTASYYQNVLRARVGSIAPLDAWQALHVNFIRGSSSMPGVTLADATERMYRTGEFMRVYWEGAAIILMADQRLRAGSAGKESLDTALEKLQRCCLSPNIGWRASDLFDKLDALTETSVFGDLYREYVGSETFPDLSETYRLLGLRPNRTGVLELIDDAPQRADRDAIMRTPR
ncbi:MAG: hypothetical protein ABI612_03195, partial [Betaproteobacteria bacterium]